VTLFGDADNASMNVFADSHGIEHPIVLDNGWSTTARYTGPQIGLPAMTLIKPGLEMVKVNGWVSESDIEAVLPR
jgi:hypothetical protein